MFCKHYWHRDIPKYMESEAEKLAKIGLVPNTYTSFISTLATFYRCKKCGKVKRFIIRG